jgi:nucleoside phosphorylase
MLSHGPNSTALDIWRKKLDYLQQQEVVTTDAAHKFALTQYIDEAKAKIADLTSVPPPGPATKPQNLKPLSKKDVYRAAVTLMHSNGSTTNLDIKYKLRAEGFYATQDDVSYLMDALATQNGWRRAPAAGHFIFTLPPHSNAKPARPAKGKKALPAIVLLTVSRYETQAVLRVFKAPPAPQAQTTISGVTYNHLGTHGQMRIVHAICEMGSAGIGAALQRTTDAILHWHPAAMVAVGIAFGMDKKTQKIGEVLVSSHLQDYELAKLNKRSTIIPRGDRATASSSLLSRLRSTDAIKCSHRTPWPKVTFGLLLSGQKLVNSFAHINYLKRLYPEAIGGEMEGLGLYAASASAKVDWIVVKGICDWGYNKSSKLKDAWQKLAARNAATVLKAALDVGSLFPPH